MSAIFDFRGHATYNPHALPCRSPQAEASCQQRIKLLEHVYNQERGLYEVGTHMGDADMKGLPGKFSFATDWFTQ